MAMIIVCVALMIGQAPTAKSRVAIDKMGAASQAERDKAVIDVIVGVIAGDFRRSDIDWAELHHPDPEVRMRASWVVTALVGGPCPKGPVRTCEWCKGKGMWSVSIGDNYKPVDTPCKYCDKGKTTRPGTNIPTITNGVIVGTRR